MLSEKSLEKSFCLFFFLPPGVAANICLFSSRSVSNVSRFLSMLEEEIYGENSPIWEADFTVPASDGTQLGHQTGTEDISYHTGL